MYLKNFRHFKQASLLGDGDSGNAGGTDDGAGAGSTDDGAGSTDGATDGGAGTSDGGKPSWRDSLSEDLRGNETLSKYGSPEALAEAYLNLVPMIGADKMMIPGEKTSPEQWKETFQKLGLPAERENYGVERGAESLISEDFHKNFLDVAHSQGVLPRQAEALLETYSGMIKTNQEKLVVDKEATEASDVAALKAEWGEAFTRKLEAANFAMSKFGGDDAVKSLNELGLGNNPHIIKLLAAVGEAKSDDIFRGETGDAFGVTTDEAQNKMNDMLADPTSPIHDKSHIHHSKTMKEYNILAAKAFGKK